MQLPTFSEVASWAKSPISVARGGYILLFIYFALMLAYDIKNDGAEEASNLLGGSFLSFAVGVLELYIYIWVIKKLDNKKGGPRSMVALAFSWVMFLIYVLRDIFWVRRVLNTSRERGRLSPLEVLFLGIPIP